MEEPEKISAEARIARPEIRWISFLTNLGLYIGMGAILIMTVLVVLNTVFRWVPGAKSLVFVEEYTGYLLVIMAFFGLACALKSGDHVQITLIPDLFSRRRKAALEAVVTVIAIVITSVLFWHAVTFLITSIRTNELAQTVTLTPLWIFRMVMVPGYLFLMFEMVVHLVWKVREYQKIS